MAVDLIKPKRALLSVSDKTNIVNLAKALQKFDITCVSTGGTAKILKEAGIAIQTIEELTHFPEMMDGRVKTLHPNVHGGLLALRDNEEHQKAMQQHNILPIDLLIVNLYPFVETAKQTDDSEKIIENIDIGGPAMIRSAAKNHTYVTVLTEPNDYDAFIQALDENNGAIPLKLREAYAAKAFSHCAAYDGAIAQWFYKKKCQMDFPPLLTMQASLKEILRYGENPHQKAALYLQDNEQSSVANGELLQGKALSYNNLQDADAAFELVCQFPEKNYAAAAIIKHANPCGIAISDNLKEAYMKALASDSQSAFGGIVALNRILDENTANEIIKTFTEVIIAPQVSPEAKNILQKKQNLRVIETKSLISEEQDTFNIKTILGGLLLQTSDNLNGFSHAFEVVSKRQPTAQQIEDMKFAFTVAKFVKSNAIVLAKNGATIGIGAGQMSRVDAAEIATKKALKHKENPKGCVLASDAFFPFTDGIEATLPAGIEAIIQPGGSIRDQEVIDYVDKQGLTMIFTKHRHFRH